MRDQVAQDEITRILKKRARDLAKPPLAEQQGEVVEVVSFALGDETYAVEVQHVTGVHPLVGLTPVPCTPDFYAGVVNLRGRILSILDIHRFLGLEGVSGNNGAQVIIVNAAGLKVGLLVSAVHDVFSLPLDELEPVLPTTSRVAAKYTRGVSRDMLVLLNLETLLKDERMFVQEQV